MSIIENGEAVLLVLFVLFLLVALIVLFVLFVCVCDVNNRADQPEESAELRAAWARAAVWQASAALTGKAAAPPALLPLPYFPYADQAQSDKPSSETVVCAICLDALSPGQLCSEVPPCRHVFHGECLGEWARSNGSCPLCRAKIVPGSDEVAIAHDMV